VKSVGRRAIEGRGWPDQESLVRTAAFLRGDAVLVPRCVFRFSSFDEADAWMTTMMIATRGRRSRATSSASELDRAFLEGVLRSREAEKGRG
jgi:hypothetical protein